MTGSLPIVWINQGLARYYRNQLSIGCDDDPKVAIAGQPASEWRLSRGELTARYDNRLPVNGQRLKLLIRTVVENLNNLHLTLA